MTMRVGPAVAVALSVLWLTGCIAVDKSKDGETTTVDISTPFGGLAVRTGESAGDTGLPVYPGARLAREGGDGNSKRATVAVGTPWVGVHVVAAEYQSDDTAERVVTYYREQMGALGAVTECRGSVDFKEGRAVCRPEPSSARIDFLEGTEQRHRIVSITPRNGITRFALVSVQTGSTN